MTHFCKTCFDNFGADKPRSLDPRYCRGCYETWLVLSPTLSDQERAKWVPKTTDAPVKPQQPLPGLAPAPLQRADPMQKVKLMGRPRFYLDNEALQLIKTCSIKQTAQKLGISPRTVSNLRKGVRA